MRNCLLLMKIVLRWPDILGCSDVSTAHKCNNSLIVKNSRVWSLISSVNVSPIIHIFSIYYIMKRQKRGVLVAVFQKKSDQIIPCLACLTLTQFPVFSVPGFGFETCFRNMHFKEEEPACIHTENVWLVNGPII